MLHWPWRVFDIVGREVKGEFERVFFGDVRGANSGQVMVGCLAVLYLVMVWFCHKGGLTIVLSQRLMPEKIGGRMIERETRAVSKSEQSSNTQFFDLPFGKYAPTTLQNALIQLARKTFLHRGKLRHKMTNLIYAIGRPLDIHRFGVNFRIGGHQNLIEYGLLLHPDYNRTEIDFLSEVLTDGAVAVDIGSNIGLYSLPLAKTGARVISIDANPAMVDSLKFNFRASDMSDADVVHAAVGDTDGVASLQIYKDDVAIVNIVEDQSGNIPIRRLDRILEEKNITRVDVLKIDVEGHEDLALAPFLEGAAGDLIPKRIVIERVSDEDYPACAKVFAKLGYRAVGRTRSNSLYQRD